MNLRVGLSLSAHFLPGFVHAGTNQRRHVTGKRKRHKEPKNVSAPKEYTCGKNDGA